jgi:addiction module RelE/StbE family toxin
MNWTIKFSSHAEKYYRKLDKELRGRVKKELSEMGELIDPLTHPAVKPLIGEMRGFYRIRIDPYRAIFSIIPESKIIAVVNLAPRSDVYKQ